MSAYFPLKANIIQRTSQEHSVSSCPTVKKDTGQEKHGFEFIFWEQRLDFSETENYVCLEI